MPGLTMESNRGSTRLPRTTVRSKDDNNAVAATGSVVKTEDNDDDDTYRSRPQLPVAHKLMRSLRELMKLMDTGGIDVDPEYQREVVWAADRMTGLVNSLMENFYIPPIILNKKPRQAQDPSAPKETLVCVDGKQRLSSVLAFIKGMIPCHDHRGEKWWFCEPVGSKRKRVLSEQQRRQFFQKEFVVFEYNNLSPEQEEDLFARVQMGVQLNLAEKMRASTGPWQELARLFVEDFPPVYSLMKDRARSKDFQLTLSCFSQIVECMYPTAANGFPALKTNYTHLPKLLSNKSAVDDGLKSHLASVWNTLKDLIETDPDTFTNGNKYLRGVQTFAPVEMVAVTVLISIHSETRNNRLLLGDIQAMRTAVRESFVDLRLNANLWKWFWEYIDSLEEIRGAIDGTTVDRITTQRTKKQSTAIGSTAAAITAAATVPKKGRFTARTKRPAATTGEEPPTVPPIMVKQEQSTVVMPGPRPPKRQRIGNSPFVAAVPSSEDIPYRDSSLSPSSLYASTQIAAPLALRSQHTDDPVPSPSQTTVLESLNQFASMHTTQHQTQPQTPSEARQRRVSALHGFQSAHRPTVRPVSNGSPTFQGIIKEESRAPVAPMVSTSKPSSVNRYAAQQQDQQQDVLAPAQPESQLPPRSRSTIPPILAQRDTDEVIDLTSDTEQERQDLLSAFKTRQGSGLEKKAPKSASGSVAKKSRIH
ncbi:hypothetical protein C7974DRAFT_400627 [Boeremia exigua]|uniref:uncharacterized protein n=1 Tax=Boeremia exigua TaxID=749465 RepID=UPI001E8E0CFA|nr:uncharacterized protein C7974DRAFT_400627 [Boeremia exigua]KAH6618677.1 hypothetical protein C7974DRAFT_400627 [Boeremia exigua]